MRQQVDVDHAQAELGTLADAHAIADALAHDLSAAADEATLDKQRLAKVETQTRVLAEAVIAMTSPVDAIAPAVQAVKDEM